MSDSNLNLPVVSFKHVSQNTVVRISSQMGRAEIVQTFQRAQLETLEQLVSDLTDAFSGPVLTK